MVDTRYVALKVRRVLYTSHLAVVARHVRMPLLGDLVLLEILVVGHLISVELTLSPPVEHVLLDVVL